jgi:anhydro-N-acetylmuramic acid kinase
MEERLTPLTVVGMMSGSSLDGMDICICKFTPLVDGIITYEIIVADTIEYEPEWIDHLSNALNFSMSDYFSFEADYSYCISMMVKDFIQIFGVDVDLIASHGHTLDHRPDEGISVQIGDPGVIAALTGVDTVADFRIQDITLGGQGAPIIPIAEKLLYPEFKSFINLGGIANISIHTEDTIIAWDTIPCNQVLNDQAMILGAEYDENGEWAKKGQYNEGLAASWDALEYLAHDIPKSLDNNWIREEYLPIISNLKVDPKDALNTACNHIATQIKKDIQKFSIVLPEKIMITGGGTHNTYLISCIEKQLSTIGIQIFIPEKTVIDYKEATMTALMGYLFAMDIPSTIPSVTGANRSTIAGKYCKG